MIIGKINFLARHWYQMKRRFVYEGLIGRKVKDPVIFQEELDYFGPRLTFRFNLSFRTDLSTVPSKENYLLELDFDHRFLWRCDNVSRLTEPGLQNKHASLRKPTSLSTKARL